MSERQNTKPMAGTTAEHDAALEIERRKQSPEVIAQFAELAKDAPAGAGPIVREAGLLRKPKDAPESGRKEHLSRADIKTNPVGVAIEPRVIRNPRADRDAYVTSPDAFKRAKLGLAQNHALGDKLPGRITVPFADQPAPVETDARPEVAEPVPSKERNWTWAALVFLLFGAMGGALIWYTQAVRVDERAAMSSRTTAAPPATETAIATATATAGVTAPAPSVVETASASARASARKPTPVSPRSSSIEETAKPSAKPAAVPTTEPTTTSGRPND